MHKFIEPRQRLQVSFTLSLSLPKLTQTNHISIPFCPLFFRNQPRKIDQYQIQSTEMEERLISKSSITPVDPFLIEKIQLKNILSGQVAHQGLMEYNNQRKQTSAKKKRKMNKPKPPTAWVFFMKYSRPNVLQTHPNAGFGEISSYVSQLWNELSVQDKEVSRKRNLSIIFFQIYSLFNIIKFFFFSLFFFTKKLRPPYLTSFYVTTAVFCGI